MDTISFVNGEKYISKYGLCGEGEFLPYFMIKDNKQYFLRNAVKGLSKNEYACKYEHDLKEMETIKQQLINNKGAYFKYYGRFDNPLDLIKWMEENNYTFESFSSIEEHFKDGSIIFHGNFKEYSGAFR
jgi:hypothetical protein